MADVGRGLKYGAGGAAAGSLAGPIGAAVGGAGGFLYGLLSGGSDDQDAVAQANAQKLAAMQEQAKLLDAYRPELAQRHMNQMATQLSTLQPSLNAMATMYGPTMATAPQIGTGLSPDTLDMLKKNQNAPVTYPSPTVVSAPPPQPGKAPR